MKFSSPALLLALWITGCAPAGSPVSAIDLTRLEIVDLTHTLDASTLYWPTSPSSFELQSLAFGPTPGGYFYSANTFSAPEHGGTHLDAPIHFAEGGATADEIPLSRLIAPVVVLDVTEQAARDPDYRLSVEDVMAWEAKHGAIVEGAIVLLRTGWSTRWPDAKSYLGDDTPGDASNLHFPSFGVDAARLVIEQRGAAAIGIDAASIDYGASTDFMVHQIAGAAGVPGLENLDRLDLLPPVGAVLVALPIKIGGGSGGPARVVALVPTD